MPRGVLRKTIRPADHLALAPVPLEDEIEVPDARREPVEAVEDIVFSAEGDVEGLPIEFGERADAAGEREPAGRPALGREEDEVVTRAANSFPSSR
jgi:hypothetical protein